MGTAWHMPIAVIGKPTGDGRQFDDGALSHRDLPLPLRYVSTDSGGHNNAVIVGHISKIGKTKDGMLPASGEFYDDESWPEDVRNAATSAMKFTQNKVIGPSVDLDQAEMETVPEPKAHAAWLKDQKGKLKAQKLAHAKATGGDCGCGGGLAAEEEHYDGPRLRMVRQGRIASATLVHIPAFAELAGHAKITPAGQHVTADGSKIENDDESAADQEARTKMAALMAAAASDEAMREKGYVTAPPKEWFDDPKLAGPSPLQITDDGRVFGHVATWDVCHVGIGDSCVIAPKSQTNYAYFHTGEVVTADGSRVPVGRLSYGGGHAAPKLGYRAAAEHYDSTSNMGAQVRAGEDEFGIWVAGAVNPEADEAALRVMRATPLSGDWRRIGGNLEMMAALHVNTPGFPIPRVTVTASAGTEVPVSLIAAGAVALDASPAPAGYAGLDPVALGREIARGMRAEQQAEQEAADKKAAWAELVAAATDPGTRADYDEAMSDLMVALVE